MKVLIIEQDQQITGDLVFCLKLRYPEADIILAEKGEKGLEAIEVQSPELIIIGSTSTSTDTVDLVARIRQFSDVGMIVLSGSETELERAKGFEAGADEYVNIPVSPVEFLARVRALLRRTQGYGFKSDRLVSHGGELVINFISHQVFVSSKQVRLTPIEYEMLCELVRNEGRVLTHRYLIDKLWGSEYVDDLRLIKRYIHSLRKKLNDDSENPHLIHTERGVGYKFVTIP